MSEELSRRECLARTGKTAAVGLGAAAVLGADGHAWAARPRADRIIGANDRIRMALIGCGGQGGFNMASFMGHSDVEIIGVCDVDSRHMEAAASRVERKY